MSKHILRAALLVSFLMWPFSALALSTVEGAGAPSSVTGLSARFKDGQITVRWDEAEGADTYHVYYGQKSILENDGAYDDFVTTEDKGTEFILTDLPPYPRIFLAVLAVNADGEESLSFIEEVQLDAAGDAMDGERAEKEVPSPSRRERELTTVGLLSAVAQSSNTVQLTFSLNVQVAMDRAIDAFTVVDNQGNTLRLTRIVIEGNTITLATDDQFPGRRYGVRVNDPVTSDPLFGPMLPIDLVRNAAVFAGYGSDGEDAPSAEPAERAATAVDEIAALQNVDSSRGGLFDSGMPILGVLIVTGAVVGWRRIRRQTTVS